MKKGVTGRNSNQAFFYHFVEVFFFFNMLLQKQSTTTPMHFMFDIFKSGEFFAVDCLVT